MNPKLLLVLFLGYASLVHAKTSEQLLTCVDIKDASQRLACYDKAMGINESKVETVKVEKSNKEGVSATEIVQQESTTSATQVIESTSNEDEKYFGQEYKRIEEAPDELRFIVKSSKKNALKEWRITLENGQVWKQISASSSGFKVKTGDEIVIKRGALNSFNMKKVGSKRSIKVKRTK